MNRKQFILRSIGLTAGTMLGGFQTPGKVMMPSGMNFPACPGTLSTFSHRLPKTDINYIHTSPYMEEVPVPEYTWASDGAYEAFLDMKYGVRLHWGIYSIWQLQKESWPFLGHVPPYFDFAKRQDYNQLYKTWNPEGFDAEQWMQHFKNWGMKMFAFISKHHEGFSMFDTRTRVKRRVNWTAAGGPAIEECEPAAIRQLNEVGAWLETNGEAIFSTRPREGELWKEGDNIRFTHSKDQKTIYAFSHVWPGELLLLASVRARENSRLYLLGVNKSLKWENTPAGLQISPGEKIRKKIREKNKLAYAFKIESGPKS
jgi:hypothetical protein